MAKVLDAKFDNKNKAGARPVKWSSAQQTQIKTTRGRGPPRFMRREQEKSEI